MSERQGRRTKDCVRCRRSRSRRGSNEEFWCLTVWIDNRPIHQEPLVEVWRVESVAKQLQDEYSSRGVLSIIGMPRDREYIPSPEEIAEAAAEIRKSWPKERLNPGGAVELKEISVSRIGSGGKRVRRAVY